MFLEGDLRVLRDGITESVHRVHVAVVDAEGELLASVGDVRQATFYRSAAKPFQTLPLVEDGVADRLGLTGEELAICSASHNSEPRHLELARSILAKAGVGEDALECGPHLPFPARETAALLRSGEEPAPIHNNCSGKHAGMIALALAHGWPTAGYTRSDHPVQRRMLKEIARWSGVPEEDIGTGLDGCGVVCFAVPLARMAGSFARFARAAGEHAGVARIVRSMTDHPFCIAGTGRLCTELMRASGGRIFVKTGAEGVYGAGVPGAGIGIALKVEDGAKRASDAALVRVLEELKLLSVDELDALRSFRTPEVRNTLGDVTGSVEATFSLERRGAVKRVASP
jgi:L-asparaginase II